MSKNIYQTLSKVDMSQHIKAVQGQRYIPWSDQWSELLKHYPEATFLVHENEVGDPFTVSVMGVMVKVSVTIENLTHTINYPVLNSYNKSLKLDPYVYKTKKGDVTVQACSTFDINTSIVRALTKCIALHGLGLYVYRDELQPEIELVGSKDLQTILDKIKEKNVSLMEVCQDWQMDKIAHLQAQNFDNMMQYLEAK